jgi:3-oxoacyl-[acyl-carrier protein] reductase
MSNENRVAIITGGGRGIGKGMALLYAKNGVDVAVFGRTYERLEETVKEIEQLGGRGLAVKCDVGVLSDVETAFDKTLEKFGRIDILVNNAGLAQPTNPITELDLSYLDSIIDTDFKGVYYCSRRAAREMIPQKRGCIVNISSIQGLIPLPCIVYGPIKAAVIFFTRILARELAQYMITVNCIAPGYVQTQMSTDQGDRNIELFLKTIPMHVPIMVEDIAELTYFLTSPKARYITGAVIAADAGATSDGGWYAFGR